MIRQMTAKEAKAEFFALLDEIANGEEFEITRDGRVVARITPVRKPHKLWGMHAGKGIILAKDEDLYSTGEPWNAM